MASFSGKFGTINNAPGMTKWNLSDSVQLPTFVASNTGCGTGRKTGPDDWSGSYSAIGGKPVVLPGESFAFAGYTAPDNGASGGTGTVYSGTAIVDSVAVTWDYTTNTVIAHTVNFSRNGALTENAAGSPYADNGTPLFESPMENAMPVDEDDDEITLLKTVTLTITSANKTYVNSGTAGGTLRRSGPIDFTVAMVREDNLKWYDKGVEIVLKLPVNATEFWLLKWAKVGDYTNFNVDRDTGNIIAHTMNFSMNAAQSGVGLGHIKKPGQGVGTAWWGTA